MKTSTAREWRVGKEKELLCSKKSRTMDRTSLQARHEPSPQLATSGRT